METAPKRSRRFVLALGGFIVLGTLLLVGGGLEAAHAENRDTFCASCHSEPESTYVARSVDADPTDLASFHTTKAVRCIDCHSGPGLMGRISALSLGARDSTRYFTGHDTQPAPLTRGITDAHCLKCHGDIAQSQTFQNHFHAVLGQWQAQSPDAASCVSCHESHVTDGTADISYLNETRTTAVCQACHTFAGGGS